METSTTKHLATEVIDYVKAPNLEGYFSYDTFRFKPKKDVNFIKGGGGLYGIFYEGLLIYVGKYQGTQKDFFAGDIITARWIKHIATITLKGNKVSFSERSYNQIVAFIEEIGDNEFKNHLELFDSLILGDYDLFTTDRGCMSTFDRFKFALDIWKDPDHSIDNMLSKLSFVYCRLDGNIETSFARDIVSMSENEVLSKTHPRCNAISNRIDKGSFTEIEVTDLFETSLLNNSIAMAGTKILPENGSEDEIVDTSPPFIKKIESSHPEHLEAIDNLINEIENLHDVSIAFTNTAGGDLRVRKHFPELRGFVNAITFEWQPKKERLLCKTMLNPEDISSNVLSIDRVGSSVLKSETFIHPKIIDDYMNEIKLFMAKAIEVRERGKSIKQRSHVKETNRFVVLDLETTGFSFAKGDRIIEIACLEIVDGSAGKHFHRRINPEREIPKRSTEVHGITNEDLVNAPTFREISKELVEFLGESDLVIHNAAFDYPFLSKQLASVGEKSLTNKFHCTLKAARSSMRDLIDKKKLDDLCDYFLIDRSSRTKHGAMIDVELTAKVFLKMVELKFIIIM